MSEREIRSVPLTEIISSATADIRYIYILHEVGDLSFCKIGRARHPEWRRLDLQSGNHRELVLSHVWLIPHRNAAAVYERAVHEKLASAMMRGEWFRLSPDRVAAVVQQTFVEFEI